MLKRFLAPLFMVLSVSCASQGELISGIFESNVVEKLDYYLYYPADYSEDGAAFGLLLFLHGGGDANGNDIHGTGPPKLLAEGKQFPFLILAPKNPHTRKWWNIHAIDGLLESIIAENNIDRKKLYLSGLSRGGSGAWDYAVQFPEKFAALAVVCGVAPVAYAHWLDKKTAVWVFHGEDDQVIPVSNSDQMVEKLRKMGHHIKYDRYKGVGHDAWVPAYQNEDLYRWMSKQKRE